VAVQWRGGLGPPQERTARPTLGRYLGWPWVRGVGARGVQTCANRRDTRARDATRAARLWRSPLRSAWRVAALVVLVAFRFLCKWKMQGWPECVEGLELEVHLVNETSGLCPGARGGHPAPWP
jgi:hypothetical protein